MSRPLRLLFVCTMNLDRSPTAESLFRWRGDIEARSAGTAVDAVVPVTGELLSWADRVLVMEEHHRAHLLARHADALAGRPVEVLDIADDYRRGEAPLLEVLRARLGELGLLG